MRLQDNDLIWFRGSRPDLPHAEQATWRGHHIGTGEYQVLPFVDAKPCVYRLVLHSPSGRVVAWCKRKVEAEFELLGPFPGKEFSKLSNRQEVRAVAWSAPMTAKVLHADGTWAEQAFRTLHMPWETVSSVAQSELLHSTQDVAYCDLRQVTGEAPDPRLIVSPAVALTAAALDLSK